VLHKCLHVDIVQAGSVVATGAFAPFSSINLSGHTVETS
jgi:hypothetical protein